MRTINPIRRTVKHYMEAGELRELRRLSKARLGDKHKKNTKKSNFVKFMESLQNREGSVSMHETLYEKWTKEVRKQMEAEGTWPVGEQETDIKILAEYLSRLQAEFWKEFPKLRWYDDEDNYAPHREEMKPYRKVLKKIFMKIRRKGMRERSFTMCHWSYHSMTWTWISPYNKYGPRDEVLNVRPYMPFNNHGGGI